MKQNYIKFNNFKLSCEQTIITANQLYHTIGEFKDCSDKEHFTGKLRFFINLYKTASLVLGNDDPAGFENYISFAQQLCEQYASDILLSKYTVYLLQRINTIFDSLDSAGITDSDDIISFVSQQEDLNFQEQQFIVDIYYSTLADYKIMRKTANGYEDEVDYYNVRWFVAVTDYCKEHNCKYDELEMYKMYDFDEEYSSEEFYVYLMQWHKLNLDFVLDYEGFKTLSEWMSYTVATLTELNLDLESIDPDDETIKLNNEIIDGLEQILF